MSLFDNDFFNDAVGQITQSLGIDTGAGAVKTIGNAVRSTINGSNSASAPAAPAVAQTSSAAPMVFGMSRQNAIVLGAGLLLVIVLVARKG